MSLNVDMNRRVQSSGRRAGMEQSGYRVVVEDCSTAAGVWADGGSGGFELAGNTNEGGVAVMCLGRRQAMNQIISVGRLRNRRSVSESFSLAACFLRG